MTDWQDMKTAPRDGRPIEIKTLGGITLVVKWETGFCDEDERECGCWVADGDFYPACWTDGVCWSSNANYEKSDPPVAWRPEQ